MELNINTSIENLIYIKEMEEQEKKIKDDSGEKNTISTISAPRQVV